MSANIINTQKKIFSITSLKFTEGHFYVHFDLNLRSYGQLLSFFYLILQKIGKLFAMKL